MRRIIPFASIMLLSVVPLSEARADLQAGFVEGYIRAASRDPSPIVESLGSGMFPGSIVDVSVDGGPVNINTRIYQERRCNWFGLNCWYEDRTEIHPFNSSEAPVSITITDSTGRAIAGPTTIKNERGETRKVIAIPAGDVTNFAKSGSLLAIVTGPPAYPNVDGDTSSGQFHVKVAVDENARVANLSNWLTTVNPSPSDVSKLLNDDPFLKRKSPDQIAEAVVKYATRFFPPDGAASEDHFALLSIAKDLSPSNPSVRKAMVDYFNATGAFGQAAKDAVGLVKDLRKQAATDPTPENRGKLSDALISLASAAGGSTGAIAELDIRKVDSILDEACTIWNDVKDSAPATDCALKRADLLNRLHDERSLDAAVTALKAALPFAPRDLPGKPLAVDPKNQFLLSQVDQGGMQLETFSKGNMNGAIETVADYPITARSLGESDGAFVFRSSDLIYRYDTNNSTLDVVGSFDYRGNGALIADVGKKGLALAGGDQAYLLTFDPTQSANNKASQIALPCDDCNVVGIRYFEDGTAEVAWTDSNGIVSMCRASVTSDSCEDWITTERAAKGRVAFSADGTAAFFLSSDSGSRSIVRVSTSDDLIIDQKVVGSAPGSDPTALSNGVVAVVSDIAQLPSGVYRISLNLFDAETLSKQASAVVEIPAPQDKSEQSTTSYSLNLLNKLKLSEKLNNIHSQITEVGIVPETPIPSVLAVGDSSVLLLTGDGRSARLDLANPWSGDIPVEIAPLGAHFDETYKLSGGIAKSAWAFSSTNANQLRALHLTSRTQGYRVIDLVTMNSVGEHTMNVPCQGQIAGFTFMTLLAGGKQFLCISGSDENHNNNLILLTDMGAGSESTIDVGGQFPHIVPGRENNEWFSSSWMNVNSDDFTRKDDPYWYWASPGVGQIDHWIDGQKSSQPVVLQTKEEFYQHRNSPQKMIEETGEYPKPAILNYEIGYCWLTPLWCGLDASGMLAIGRTDYSQMGPHGPKVPTVILPLFSLTQTWPGSLQTVQIPGDAILLADVPAGNGHGSYIVYSQAGADWIQIAGGQSVKIDLPEAPEIPGATYKFETTHWLSFNETGDILSVRAWRSGALNDNSWRQSYAIQSYKIDQSTIKRSDQCRDQCTSSSKPYSVSPDLIFDNAGRAGWVLEGGPKTFDAMAISKYSEERFLLPKGSPAVVLPSTLIYTRDSGGFLLIPR